MELPLLFLGSHVQVAASLLDWDRFCMVWLLSLSIKARRQGPHPTELWDLDCLWNLAVS